ncbi:MAG: c-type cytochrome biogenesis protein CcsB [Gammaproteobacteria bacterium]|nr:c-type cytochrome biogenesis protein CcsB [Gammaproteobacteria bacterium]
MSVTHHDITLVGIEKRSLLRKTRLRDGLWAALVAAGAGYAYYSYHAWMSMFSVGILAGAAVLLIALGWYWNPIRVFSVAVAAVSVLAVWLYGGSLANAHKSFFLEYLIASQPAIMWMSALYVGATLVYFMALFARSEFAGKVATALTWSATAMGFVGMMVRWRESYLLGSDIGHIPVSNLYEVFVLFAIITALLYLYYEGKYRTRALGGFVLFIISAAIGFLLWLDFSQHFEKIQPLVPALQSYWMKMHVPANFIGYGSFSLSAMVGVAYLLREYAAQRNPAGLLATRLPAPEVLDDIMYKAIALGFGFFTVATILGALWAAEAWGGYWSWDPKETWALIVWLNYAAWLHMRLTKGWRGKPMAWWSVIGLAVTTFCFLGVNMFLSGLHSYGRL